MKIMSMADMIRMNQVEHVHNEKNILQSLSHPFLISLIMSEKDTRFLYLLFPFIPGGEIFSQLRRLGRFSSPTALFYAAEITSALAYLHSLGIIFRDIKLENILLDSEGHIKIVDFGFAKEVRGQTWSLCGTPEYLAPELILNTGHSFPVDWWALGVLVYEMVVGRPPFWARNILDLYSRILEGRLKWPEDFEINVEVKSFVSALLVKDQSARLGCGEKGVDEIKSHIWMEKVDWEDVDQRKLHPPLLPEAKGIEDGWNYQNYPEEDWWDVEEVEMEDIDLFNEF